MNQSKRKNKMYPLEENLFSINVDALNILKLSRGNGSMKSLIKSAYEEVLRQYHFNITRIVKDLDMPRQSFYNNLKKYGVDLKKIRGYE